MESYLSEEALWASGLSARLRLIQANFADDPFSVRQGHIVDEIERALKPVSPTRRKAYLDSLAERFPAWEGLRSTANSDVPVGAAVLTAEEMLAGLIQLAPTLSSEARASFASQLQAVGLSVKEAPNSNFQVPPELGKKLGLPADKPLQLERALKWLVISTEFALALDQLSWVIWKAMAPRSAIRRESEINRLTGTYLAGDVETSTAQVQQSVEKTRRLIAALVTAVGKAGSAYAQRYVQRLSPDVIEDWARMEKKYFESLEGVCWQKFLQQAREHATVPAIENEIQEAIAKAAEEIFLTRRPG